MYLAAMRVNRGVFWVLSISILFSNFSSVNGDSRPADEPPSQYEESSRRATLATCLVFLGGFAVIAGYAAYSDWKRSQNTTAPSITTPAEPVPDEPLSGGSYD